MGLGLACETKSPGAVVNRHRDVDATRVQDRDPRCSLTHLPKDLVNNLFEYLVGKDLRLAVRLSSASTSLRQNLQSLMTLKPELGKRVSETRDEHVMTALKDARQRISGAEPTLFVFLWILGLALGFVGARGTGEWWAMEIYPCVVVAYSVAMFSRSWNPNAASLVLLIFDFSLSYAGNIFCTLQATAAQTRLALAVALASSAHALVLSAVMMSVSVQSVPWKDLGGMFHRTQSNVMLAIYFSLAMYYEGLPGVWRLASACCRLFTLVHISWLGVLPRNS